jgi:hypothetical protein
VPITWVPKALVSGTILVYWGAEEARLARQQSRKVFMVDVGWAVVKELLAVGYNPWLYILAMAKVWEVEVQAGW